ncbi:alpha/beta hydrolase [Microbacterium ulmi]|uniref:DUF1023 domain-containing protein n=1 Tax=Microbacterium ulmi TaxID=179095 RepID=A0A7Y2M1D2_9MICO|nr:alpha/beta hydrolase [Microbacterium ulmi]NII69389.1 uncharacterized protein YukE [Microbacterium ulmi]NNH03999.1 hypothetical protein [Microbacterium ulmi]
MVDAANPGAGDPEAIGAQGAVRARKAADVRRALTAVTAASADASGAGWKGHAQQGFVASLAATVPDLSLLADGLDAQAAALAVYAAEVRGIRDLQRGLESRRTAADEEIGQAEGSLWAARRQADGPFGGSLDTQSRIDRLERRIGDAQRELRTVASEWDELVSRRARADAACAAVFEGPAVRGALARLSGAAPSTASGRIALLEGLSATDLKALLASHPDILDDLAHADADTVAEWWRSLDGDRPGVPSEAQELLLAAIPATLGSLEGIAYWARDRANRTVLAQRIADAEAALEHAEEMPPLWEMIVNGEAVMTRQALAIAEAQERLDELVGIRQALRGPAGGAPRMLVLLSADVPPLAAVSVGDLDTAASVTYAVPGMGTTAAGMKGWTDGAQRIFDAQAGVTGNDTDRAVVAWIGYETPPVPGADGGFDVLSNARADAGADKLRATLAGFGAVRADDGPRVSVVAHSYGTTTSSIALSAPGVHVDTFVSVGSAGLPGHISDAGAIHADEVYAGQARDVLPFLEGGQGDQWAWTGRDFSDEHPVNPVDAGFGARTFGVDGDNGMRPVTDHSTHVDGGTGYLDAGTESLRNVALATTGQGDAVSPYRAKGPTVLQQALIESAKQGGMAGG